MNHPRNQFSHTYDHNLNDPFAKNDSSLSQNNESCSNSSDLEFLQFRPDFHHEEFMGSDGSGASSPPLWKNSPSPSQPLLSRRSLSPNSRIQAIARGQRELMEMVKNIPESSYELSLKDLVEHHKTETQTTQSISQNLQRMGVVKVKREDSKINDKNMTRIGSFESKGLFLKMMFPFSLKSKKKHNFLSNSSGKVSPKPEVLKGGGERDWWKKKFTGSSDSDSSRTSNNSGSTESSGGSIDRKKNGLLTGCWPFFLSRSGKSVD